MWLVVSFAAAACRLTRDTAVTFVTNGYGHGFSNAVDLYNSASGTWSTAQLFSARGGLAATSVGNVAIFAGGTTGAVPSTTSNSTIAYCAQGLLLVFCC